MRILGICFLVAAAVLSGRAQLSEPARIRLSNPDVRKELVSVVTAQLSAFRADDWEKAYGYAARTFQNVVPPESFATLITRNYSLVWKNTRAEYGWPSDNGHIAVLPVRVFSNSRSEAYTWLLVKEGEAWRITGVVPQKTADGA